MSSADKPSFSSVESAPLGPEFLAFMQGSSEAVDRHSDLRSWMQNELATDSDRILSTFVLVSTGCWNRGTADTQIVTEVLSEIETVHDLQDPDVQQGLTKIIQNELEAIDATAGRWDWLHNHRKNLHFEFSHAGEVVVESLIGLSEAAGSHDNLKEYVDTAIEQSSDPFYTIFTDMKSLTSFGRLSAFDFLELVDTVAGIDNITPQNPRAEYIRNNNPRPGFFYVFLADGPEDDSVEELDWEEGKQMLGASESQLDKLVGLLCDGACERLGWGEESVMYDVESGLCNFTKGAESRKLNFGGDDSDSRTSGSGC